jgi:hypothetical protein
MYTGALLKTSLYCLLLTACCLLFTPTAAAHGGGEVQLAAVPAGPYRLTVWMNPGTAQAGRPTHVTVAVADALDQSPVLDAAVLVEAWSTGMGEKLLSTPATTEQSTNKLFYETDFVLPETGPVEITIRVSGAAGEGQAGYTTEVAAAQNTSWLYSLLAGVGVLAFALLWRAWTKRPRAVRPRRPSIRRL